MVVNRHSELLFRLILTDDVLVEETFDLRGLRQMYVFRRRLVILIFVDDVLANTNTLVTDEDSRPCYELPDVILAFVTE